MGTRSEYEAAKACHECNQFLGGTYSGCSACGNKFHDRCLGSCSACGVSCCDSRMTECSKCDDYAACPECQANHMC